MTIRTKVEIGGTEVTDYLNLNIARSMQDYNSTSNFWAIIDSPFGRHATTWTVGEEVVVYANQDTDPTTKIFTGILEKIKFQGKGASQKVILSGRDYCARLQDVTIQPIVYTDSEISTIVQNIVDNEVTDITTNNVNVTTTTVERIAFNQQDVFSSFQTLAKLADFIFYVDEDKDLHFEEKSSISSGYSFDNTNIVSCRFDTTREGMANIVWVYGDVYRAGYQEILDADGGSVFTLIDQPHDSYVEYLGNPQRGGVFGMNIQPASGTDYLVNFYDGEIIFVSGTTLGYDSTPASGGSVLFQYNRDVPVVRYGRDESSIAAFGPKTLIINDKSIKEPNTAKILLRKTLDDSNPFKRLELNVSGWFSINPGETIGVTLDDFNVSETVQVLDITYKFDKNTIQSEDVIKLRVDKKILDVTDAIAELKRDVKGLQAGDMQNAEILPRFQQGTGSCLVVGSRWEIRTRTHGSSFVLGTANSNPGGVGYGGVLGSVVASGINFLGDSRTALGVVASGGYNYV